MCLFIDGPGHVRIQHDLNIAKMALDCTRLHGVEIRHLDRHLDRDLDRDLDRGLYLAT